MLEALAKFLRVGQGKNFLVMIIHYLILLAGAGSGQACLPRTTEARRSVVGRLDDSKFFSPT